MMVGDQLEPQRPLIGEGLTHFTTNFYRSSHCSKMVAAQFASDQKNHFGVGVSEMDRTALDVSKLDSI